MSNYPYLGPAAHTSVGANTPVTRIVIHGTVSPCVSGGARATAGYFRSQGSGGSAHYVVDPGEVVQVVHDDTIAWHAPPNKGSIGIELCDPQAGPASRWSDANHGAMLARAATLTAEKCIAYGIPVTKVFPADLLAGKRGICGHVDVTNAWHQSDHTDPGPDFPWASFLASVRTEVTRLQGAPAMPTRATAATPLGRIKLGLLAQLQGADAKTVNQSRPLKRAQLAVIRALVNSL